VEAGSNTSYYLVGGDEKGSLESETVKYGRESHGTFYTAEHFFITIFHGPHGLYCYEGVFTDPLPSNRRPILGRVVTRGNDFM
jgi:hypothetical protein